MNDDLAQFLRRLGQLTAPTLCRHADRALTWALSNLPWGSHSLHESWLCGFRDGVAEGYARGLREGRR